MSEQAIETEEEVETLDPSVGVIHDDDEVAEEIAALEEVVEEDQAEQLEVEPEPAVEAADDDEVEIVIDGDDEPSSKPLRKGGFYKRLSKVTGQRDAATEQYEEEKRKREIAEEEAKLWRIKAGQTSGVPREDQFETYEQFEAAKGAYDKQVEDERIAKLVEENTRAVLESAQAQNIQAEQSHAFEAKFDAAMDQAEKLKIKDFDTVGEQVTDVIGQPLMEYILTNHEKSAAMIYKLSKNPGKARQFHELSLNPHLNGVKLAQELTRFEDGIKFKSKLTPAADPETTVDKGTGTTDGILKGARFE